MTDKQRVDDESDQDAEEATGEQAPGSHAVTIEKKIDKKDDE